MRVLITSVLFCFLLSACGEGQEEAGTPDKATEKSTEKADTRDAPTIDAEALAAAHGKTVDGTFYPDHDKGAEEFQIRSSLAGVERMIENYKEQGLDTSELESKRAELKKKLSKITG